MGLRHSPKEKGAAPEGATPILQVVTELELVAHADLEPPDGRGDVDEIVGLEVGFSVEAGKDVTSLGVHRSAGESGYVLKPGELAATLDIPAAVEEVQEVVDRRVELDHILLLTKPTARTRQFLRERHVHVKVPVVAAAISLDRPAGIILGAVQTMK